MIPAIRRLVVFAVISELLAPAASAQSASADQQRLLHRARVKTIGGLAFIGMGLVVLPAGLSREDDVDGRIPSVSVGSMMAGGLLVWSGAQDRRKAFPQTSIGVVVGRRTAIQIRRSW